MALPKILGFDGRSLRTEKGMVIIDKFTYADGGEEKSGNPRFKEGEFEEIWDELVAHYARVSGSDILPRRGTIVRLDKGHEGVLLAWKDGKWIVARSNEGVKGPQERIEMGHIVPRRIVVCTYLSNEKRYWWAKKIIEEDDAKVAQEA